jgi:hypothetical protein
VFSSQEVGACRKSRKWSESSRYVGFCRTVIGCVCKVEKEVSCAQGAMQPYQRFT